MKKFVVGLSLTIATLLRTVDAYSVHIINNCTYDIELYDNENTTIIQPQQSTDRELEENRGKMFRHGMDPIATLGEFTVYKDVIYYDLSEVNPKQSYTCDPPCREPIAEPVFNVPMAITITGNGNGPMDNCKNITCNGPRCPDAYWFPSDDIKTHVCPANMYFTLTFCPDEKSSQQHEGAQPTPATPIKPISAPAPEACEGTTDAPTADVDSGSLHKNYKIQEVLAHYEYTEKQIRPTGTYDAVVDLTSCTRKAVSVSSNIGPVKEDISLLFRGPMKISDILVYQGVTDAQNWHMTSRYRQSDPSADVNIVFLTNKNISYGPTTYSPQCLASADGKTCVNEIVHFDGVLADASGSTGPYEIGKTTGEEVNIMTQTTCSENSQDPCTGYHEPNANRGWSGDKKMFVIRARTKLSSTRNKPAIWALNSQIPRASQYGCNCRGMGFPGGCGELDMFEVTEESETNFSTTYYMYQDQPLGKQNFAQTSDDWLLYVLIIDGSGGVIKLIQMKGEFDFNAETIAYHHIQELTSLSKT